MPFARLVFCVAVTLLATGCLENTLAAPPLDVEIESMLAERSFESSGYLQLSRAPYASTLEPGAKVNVFVSRDAPPRTKPSRPTPTAPPGPIFPSAA
jgi:hypothetical protein